MDLLSAHDVTRTYERGSTEVRALNEVSLDLGPGSYTAVLGKSGSGKSTLLYQLGLLDRPDAGEVTVDGVSASDMSDDQLAELRCTKLGFVFQSFQLLPGLSAWENVAIPGVLAGSRIAGLRDRALDLLGRVGLAERADHLPGELSGGEQQRVAVARALFSDPVAVLADEPTGALDSETGIEVMELLERATVGQGRALVVVTHDHDIADRATTIVRMHDGEIV